MFLFSSVQDVNDDEKHYWEWGKLEWSFFQAPVPNTTNVSAITNAGVHVKWRVENSLLKFDIVTIFNKKKSWVLKEKQSIDLLNHEQKHFDLKEYTARCLREVLVNHKFKSINSIKDEINNLKKIHFDLGKARQKLYDKETNLSKDKKKQIEWDKKIDGLLASKNEYSNSHLEINIGYLF